MSKKPVFVVWGFPYHENSGGIVVLHQLSHEIAALGFESYIYNAAKNPNLQGTSITHEEFKKIDADTCIVIYAECIRGNPLGAKHVVRWILNTPGVMGGDGIYQDTDMAFLYCPFFTLEQKHLIKGELCLFSHDAEFFKDLKMPRSGQCVAIRKGRHKELNKHDKTALVIDGMMNAELLEVFNKKQTFVSYDHVTFLSVQAALSGCVSIVIPPEGLSKESWCSSIPALKYGVAYGFNDIQWAVSTQHLVKPHLEELGKKNYESFLNFIEICSNKIA